MGNARIEGMVDDLNMSEFYVISTKKISADKHTPAGNQYLTGLTLYFIGYVLFEVSVPISSLVK